MSRRRLAATVALTGIALAALVATAPAFASPPDTLSGVLEVLHEDHLDEGRSVHQYRLVGSDGSRTELVFGDRGPEGLGAKSVRVTGTKVRPGVLQVDSSSAVQEAGGASGTPVAAEATAAVTKKVAVILFDFADSAEGSRAITAPDAAGVVFGDAASTPSVRDFMTQTSFAQLTLAGGTAGSTGDVFDWVRIAASSTDNCDFNTWGTAARAAAAAAGFNDASYDQVIHLMPRSTCTFGGVAYMPGKYSWTVLRDLGDANLVPALRRVTSHEYGHSLGIHHAGSYRCTERGTVVSLSTSDRNCTLDEYGDPFSVLGMSTAERQYHGYQKGRVGWITAGMTGDLTTSGTYTLSAVNVTGQTQPQVLRIARPAAKGAKDFLYLELRQPSGNFDNFATDRPVVNGVSIRTAPDYGVNAVSKLIDTTPETSAPSNRALGDGGGFEDAALAPGKTFTDPASGVTIRTDSVGGGVATVTVTFPATPTKGGRK